MLEKERSYWRLLNAIYQQQQALQLASSLSLLKGLPSAVRDQSNSLQMVNWLDSITRWVTHLTLSLDLSLPISPSPCFLSSKRKSCFVQVSILLRKVKRVDPSENVKNPSQKYMKIVTVDNFDFWFMGFLNYQKSFNCLQQALSQSWMSYKIQAEMVFLSASLDVFTWSKNKASTRPKTLYKVFVNEKLISDFSTIVI